MIQSIQPFLRLISVGFLLSFSVVNNAYAAENAGAGEAFMSLAPLVFIFVIFYFLLIRPQQKRIKAHREMIGELKKGDSVITAGGVLATVASVNDDLVKLDIAEGVRIQVKRDTILEQQSKV
ncbi:MAG: preprotein translocase subunit YajC [Mariprofundaceae bacterium]|nr:preprotein translocase subunit YajC [Mariprofundaceae bacterium]